MASAQLPRFTETLVDDIPTIVTKLRQTFLSHKTRSVAFRLEQLRKLYWAIVDHERELLQACQQDLGKGNFEAMVSEITWVRNDIVFMTKNLEKWMRDESPADISWSNKLVRPKIRKDPLGVVLVIGAFNFPINLSFSPMIAAISGGNVVALKPSEQAPTCAAVMQKIMIAALNPDCCFCVQGGVPQTSALLEQKWDKIFFTGSSRTAKIVTLAAAKHLTPVTLELGGRNPAIVTKQANIRLAARRLLWAKTVNAGQVCVSQNYVLVDREVISTFISELRIAMQEFFPSGVMTNPDYSRIVNIGAFNRIKKMLESTSGRVIIGGIMDAEQLLIEPTVIEVSDAKDPLLIEESFGPLIPVLPVEDLDQAINIANDIQETPLAVYAFGSKTETDKILASIRSGGASVNDGFFHGVIPTLAFGGVGESGTGSYRGKASFDCFVHERSITKTPNWMEKLLTVRYPPFNGTDKLQQFNKMSALMPNFDREGHEKVNFIRRILTAATGSRVGGAFTAALAASVYLALKLLTDGRIYPLIKSYLESRYL